MQKRKCKHNIVLLYYCCNQINLNKLIDKVYVRSREELLNLESPKFT